MTERDDDIDFDFFDEPKTEEATQRRPRLPPREPSGGGGPRQPTPVRPPAGFTPLLRLVGLIAFAILIVVLLVFWVKSCQGSAQLASYQRYMAAVGRLAQDSVTIGRELNDKLTTPGIKEAALETALGGLAQQQAQDVAAARAIRPPGRLREEHRYLIESLELRASGLGRLRQAFHQTANSTNAAAAGGRLADEARLLTASDVIWDFDFLDPASAELKRQGLGVNVPDSNIVQNSDLVTARSLVPVFQRLHGTPPTGAGSGNGIHQTALVSVRALPSNQLLSTATPTTITSSPDLSFAVTIKDTGSFQEVRVAVRLTVLANPSIVKSETIPLINAGEEKVLTFGNFSNLPYGSRSGVKVEIQPVPNEKTLANNTASYPVFFSIG